MSKDSNKKHFFDKLKYDEVKEILENVAKANIEVTLWPKGKSETDAEVFEAKDFNHEKKTLTLTAKAGLLKKLTGSKLVDKDVFIKIRHTKYTYFSTAPFTYVKEDKTYVLTFNMEFFRSQQRENYRVMASRYNIIQFKVDEEVFEGLDVSAGGTSFMTTPDNSERFPKDKVFMGVTLRFNKKNFEIGACKIAGQWGAEDKEGNPMIKLGVQFTKMASFVETELYQHINQEARADEMRKKFGS